MPPSKFSKLAAHLLAAVFLFLLSVHGTATESVVRVSLIHDQVMGEPVRHGLDKLRTALEARKVVVDEPSSFDAAHGDFLIVAGLPSAQGAASQLAQSVGARVPARAESLLIRNSNWKGRPAVLLSGADDAGLMYALLDTADRVGWAADPLNPLSEIRDVSESPDVEQRGVTIFTMQQAQFENRLHDEQYWAAYFDTLARDRFNTFQVLFAYEMDGYMCPAYPYFIDVAGFPNVRVPGLSHEQQQRNLADLHRLIRMAHDRAIKVTIGLWCHYYRYTPTGQLTTSDQPVEGKVFGLTEANLIPYTKAALGQFLRAVPEVDTIMLLMHNESGLKTQDMKDFWQSIYRVMKEAAPNMQYEVRAKGVSDDLIDYGLSLGLKIRVNTKYWAEQVGLPFHPTHIQELNQFERRHGYSDMLKYPRNYDLHWTLWTSGTTRILLWGDPEYVRRFAATTHLGGVRGFDIMEPLATKMAGHPQLMKPFDLLQPPYRYYRYDFERYWHFFQVFGRLTYNPNESPEIWQREFEARFGKAAASYVEQGLHRASQILPRIVAYCLPPNRFPTTRGWPERQREEDLPAYASAEPSDLGQFLSFDEAARNRLDGTDSPLISPMATSRWFAQASEDVLKLAAEAERAEGSSPSKEFISTMVDLKILANLALYHSRRIPAGLNFALFQRTHDLNALDDAIAAEKNAIDAWSRIVQAAGDVYSTDLMMGLPQFDLSGHWKDELVKLNQGLAKLEQMRADFHPDAHRVVGRYELDHATPPTGYERVPQSSGQQFEAGRSNVVTLDLPDGRYLLHIGIQDPKKAHGPMWIEANGIDYTKPFTVPAGQLVEKTLETSAVNGKMQILFDKATSADWYASTLTITAVDPLIAHVPVRRLSPGEDLILRATVSGVDAVSGVQVVYGNTERGFATATMERVAPLLYRTVIPAARIAGGTTYTIEATDSAGRSNSTKSVAVMVTGDHAPPALTQMPLTKIRPGEPVGIVAHVRDDSGVKWVRLRYRGLSQHQEFRTLAMLPMGRGDEYAATVPAANIDPKFDFMYLFEVMDNAGNGKIYPDLEKETPYIVVPMDRDQLAAAK
ncbi:MAG TPA: hypothetical protein VG675_01195 [Bryobacteraceae bacterium]|nr:hypothetical protein [Bryobacteraceae bacterium]